MIGGPKGAAAKLGLKRTTLIHKMQKLGFPGPTPDRSGRDGANWRRAELAAAKCSPTQPPKMGIRQNL